MDNVVNHLVPLAVNLRQVLMALWALRFAHALGAILLLTSLACTSGEEPPATAVPTETSRVEPASTSASGPTSTTPSSSASTPTTAIVSTFTPVPTPDPTPTTTQVPTSTSSPTVPTSEAGIPADAQGLPTVAPSCSPPPCNTRVAPGSSHVDWIELPRITANGEFSLVARVHEGHELVVATPAPNGGRLNLIFSDGPDLYGHILPVDNTPGYRWREKPGQWIADVYDYEDKILTVVAQMDLAAVTHEGLRLCLWTGGYSRQETYILDCQHVEQP